MLIYKGFIGQIDYDEATQRLVGEVVNSVDVLEFNGQSAQELKANFRQCVDEYLAFQREYVGNTPIPFVGNFTVCLSRDKQNQVINAAREQGQTISHWLNQRVDLDLSRYFAKSA